MSLTKPKLSQLTFTGIPDFPVSFPDTLITLNNNGRQANLDVGLVFNRTLGSTAPNVALYWSESTQSFVTAYTNSSGNTDSNVVPTSYANITSGVVTANTIYTTTGIFYANGAPAGGSPGGSQGSIQFNNNQTLSGSTVFYDNATGNTVITSTTPSTSFNTGAVVIDGGMGVAGSAYIAQVYTNGLFWAGNSQVIQTGGGGGGSSLSMDWGFITDIPTASATYDFGTIAGASGYTVTTLPINEFATPTSPGDLMTGTYEIDLLEPNPGSASYDLA
jgi:hypothetical protein